MTTKLGDAIAIQVRNDAGAPLRAAAIIAHYSDATGKKIRKEVLTQVIPKLPEAKLWQPNEVWIFRTSRRSAEDGLTVEYVADYVLAEDGTTWGPDTEKQSEYIRGLLTGLAAKRP